MGKLSNDSDSEKRRNRRSRHSNNKRRSSSSESGSSRSRYKRNVSRTSRSRDQSYKSRRSRSGSRYKSYKSKLKHRDSRRSRSRGRHRRSKSKDYIREYVTKKRSSSSSSSTSNSVSSSDAKKISKGSVKLKIDEKQDFDIPPMDREVLDEINTDSFEQKSFSSKKKLPNTIVIDLKKQTITVPELEPVEPDSIFHHNLFLSEEARTEKWVKELYVYRQKALQQGVKSSL